MNHSKFLILLMPVCLILIVSCAPAAAPPSTSDTQVEGEEAAAWEIIHELEIEHATTVAGFLNNTFGLTAGYAGEVHYTTDGGKTWPRADNTSKCRFGLDIVNENLAWHVGNGGQVRVSTDGGQTWQAVTNLAHPSINPFISFVDAQTGWAGFRKQLWATADGGQTWTEVALPEDVGGVIEISLRTATDGYLMDNTATLYVTQDGGRSWSAQTLDLVDGMIPLDSAHGAAIRFFDADNGVVIVNLIGDGNNQILALRTTDGGQTWVQQSVPVSVGELFLSHDGTTLTVVGLTSGKVTVLGSNTSPLAMTQSN